MSVRVARRMPANAAAGIEVAAIIKNAGGELRRRTEKTDAGGRAIFEGMVPGDEFNAEVDRRRRDAGDQTFTMPPQGGLRTMLIAALGARGRRRAAAAAGAAAGAAEGDDAAPFTLGATAGVAIAGPRAAGRAPRRPRVRRERGAHPAATRCCWGWSTRATRSTCARPTTDAGGVAHFAGLPHGDGSGYAAVVEWHGLRLGTAPFPMPEASGARAEIRALARTADPR